ncbi:MAG: APC family permease [Acidobacteria bacterium]|nr:APC family permease [Acidobacteriota bacterium]MBV9477304.1 APC family permease [Acidobacteriota bacterium]
MSFVDRLLGRRLASWETEDAKIGAFRGVPVLGLDGLASAAYGPEAALAILIPLGAIGLRYIAPITAVVLGLLAILYFSYRQTIAAYPNGGGSYIVARENLGTRMGLLSAAALLLDYILNVAVGISAGVGALVSAVPALHAHILSLCLGVLVLIAILNLRGVRESSTTFAVPTYFFVASLGTVMLIGVYKAIVSGGHPQPLAPIPATAAATTTASLWLLLRSFASGCTAMTGVEAVSNGVPIFKEPPVVHAHRALTAIVAILGCLLAGIAYLSHAYGITAMDQQQPGYQSILSSLVAAVVGRGFFYYVTLAAVLAVLSLSANTSFADFPRLCRVIAEDEYLPHAFANVGRRLVYSGGIIVLTVLAGGLLIAFGGITDRLIPLFAVGAFGAFTTSQAGMVVHWKRIGARKHWHSLAINAVGAVVTGVALVVIIIAKFKEGAWITLVLIPAMLLIFRGTRRHYAMVDRQMSFDAGAIDVTPEVEPPVVVVPIKGWNNLAAKAIRFAMTMSPNVVAVHVFTDPQQAEELRAQWSEHVETPLRDTTLRTPKLVLLSSPYRRLFGPIVQYVDHLRQECSGTIAVILPDLVEGRWWEYLLHTHRAGVLRSLLLLKGSQRVVVISVPWYLERRRNSRSKDAP